MASANKFNAFVNWIMQANVNAGSDTLKVFLTNTAPVSTNSIYSDISANDLSTGNGYTAGGAAVTVTTNSQSSGTYTLGASGGVSWTATGSVGPFRYAVLYDSTPASNKTLILWWDYGSSVTLASGDSFTVSWASGILTIA